MNISVILLNPNKHLIDSLRELETQGEFKIKYFIWNKSPKYRIGKEWEFPENSVQLSKYNPIKFFRNLNRINKSDQVQFHGMMRPFPHTIFYIWLTLFRKKRIFISSEGFEKQRNKKLPLKALVNSRFVLNSKKITYLAIGYQSDLDYKRLGFKNWSFRKFGFSEHYIDCNNERIPNNSDTINLLFIGRLIGLKNIPWILSFIKRYQGSKNIKFHVAGSGSDEEALKNQATEIGGKSEVIFYGHLSQTKLHDLFQMADIMVLPSNYDGWGVVVNQALHYSLPVVISENVRAGKDYLVEHEKNGFICKNKEEFNEYLERLIEDASLRQMFSTHATAKYKNWNIKEIAKRLGEVFKNDDQDYTEGPLKKII